MLTQCYVSPDTYGSYTPTCTANTTVLREGWRTTEQGLHLTLSLDNEAGLAWLEDALAYAFTHSRRELWAYLEAVMDEVLFEMELSASQPHG